MKAFAVVVFVLVVGMVFSSAVASASTPQPDRKSGGGCGTVCLTPPWNSAFYGYTLSPTTDGVGVVAVDFPPSAWTGNRTVMEWTNAFAPGGASGAKVGTQEGFYGPSFKVATTGTHTAVFYVSASWYVQVSVACTPPYGNAHGVGNATLYANLFLPKTRSWLFHSDVGKLLFNGDHTCPDNTLGGTWTGSGNGAYNFVLSVYLVADTDYQPFF